MKSLRNVVWAGLLFAMSPAVFGQDAGWIVAWGDSSGVPAPNTGFMAVAAGWFHSLGLKSDGSIVAWGENNEGQCNVPSPNTGFAAVAAGGQHSLGLRSDGSIVAWGRNNLGQCSVPSPNTGFVAVAAGGQHSLGLTEIDRTLTLTLAVTPSASGTVLAYPSPYGDGKYASGTIVTLTANPNGGYAFSSWSGNISGSNNPTQVTMDGDRSVTANFTELRYALALEAIPLGGGSIDASPPPEDDGKYAYGTVVTLTANPAAAYHFTCWAGDASGRNNPTQVTMNGNKSVTACFEGYLLTLVVTNAQYGSVLVEPNLPAYLQGSTVTLTATPIEGRSFTEWTIWGDPNRYPDPIYAVVDSNLVLQLTMDHDYTVEAAFKCASVSVLMLPTMVLAVGGLAMLRRRP